jgi:hypothetical protein
MACIAGLASTCGVRAAGNVACGVDTEPAETVSSRILVLRG